MKMVKGCAKLQLSMNNRVLNKKAKALYPENKKEEIIAILIQSAYLKGQLITPSNGRGLNTG